MLLASGESETSVIFVEHVLLFEAIEKISSKAKPKRGEYDILWTRHAPTHEFGVTKSYTMSRQLAEKRGFCAPLYSGYQ